jgi:hypothetical protein
VTAFVVHLEFTDGTERDVDLEKYLRGPIFEPIRSNPARFQEVRVEPAAGTISWPNGPDIDPDVLYLDLPPAWMHGDSSRPLDAPEAAGTRSAPP